VYWVPKEPERSGDQRGGDEHEIKSERPTPTSFPFIVKRSLSEEGRIGEAML